MIDKKILTKKIRILRKDLRFFPNNEFKSVLDSLEKKLSSKSVEGDIIDNEIVRRELLSNKSLEQTINRQLNIIAKNMIYYLEYMKKLGTPLDLRMGETHRTLLKNCPLCDEGKINHICIGLYKNRTSCYQCMNDRIQVQQNIRCFHCQKQYLQYRRKYISRKKECL